VDIYILTFILTLS